MERIITADLHTHLLEKKVEAEEWWNAVKESNLDVVAITEHAEFNPKKAYELLYESKKEDILLIPGAELNTSIGHVLAYGETPKWYENTELLEIGVKIEKAIEIAKKENIVLSIAHPWGFELDSAMYRSDPTKITEMVKREEIGTEAYNGMIGNLSEFILKSKWVKKPWNFFAYMEGNRISRYTGFSKIAGRVKHKIDKRAQDLIYRNNKIMEFGETAKYITAGSDAHSADRIGTGILKIKFGEEVLTTQGFLKALKDKKKVVWAGPRVEEVEKGVYEKRVEGLKRKEIFSGLKYASKNILSNRRKTKKGQKG